MNYYIDTEFLEGKQKEKFPISLFRKETLNTIDLISIGIVAEDGREYYAISKDFNLKEAWSRYDEISSGAGDANNWLPSKKVYWIRENVLKPIFEELLYKGHKEAGIELPKVDFKLFTYKNCKNLINSFGKSNKEIAKEIKEFCSMGSVISNRGFNINYYVNYSDSIDTWIKVETIEKNNPIHYDNIPVFYAYYADYDWVVFCWLFGNMIDLPDRFPMYCNDLKQMIDEKALTIPVSHTVELGLTSMKLSDDYPKQTNKHNALDDAKWNKELHKFIKNI